MATVRQNTQELLTALLHEKGSLPKLRAKDMAIELVGWMGLNGPKGELEGTSKCVTLYTRRGVTSAYSRPADVPIVWVQCDDLETDGLDAVEVI